MTAHSPNARCAHGSRIAAALASALLLLQFLALSSCRALFPGDPPPRPSANPSIGTAPALPGEVASEWRIFGASTEGRPLRMRTLGTGSVRALWIGGIHGDETEGEVATRELPAAFLAEAGLGRRVTLTIVEDVNPDGRAAGERCNGNGVDLNRNFPARNYAPGADRGTAALSEPEARALHDLLLELRPDVVFVAHSSSAGESGARSFINFDGPADALARAFSNQSGYPVVLSSDIHSTPGSLGSFAGVDLGIPTLTIEYERGREAGACWNDTRAAILAVLGGITTRVRACTAPLPAPARVVVRSRTHFLQGPAGARA